MSRSVFVSPGKRGQWELSVGAETSVHAEFEEAMEAARVSLCDRGGGTIYVAAGQGRKADSVRVPSVASPAPSAPVVTAPPPAPPRPPEPTLPTQPSAPSAPSAQRKPANDAKAKAKADVAALSESYEAAQIQIEAFGDLVERDIGRGTLRLEASQALGRLRAGGTGLSADDLKPLSDQLPSLDGGTVTETAVKAFDSATRKVLKDIGKSLLALKLTGSVALILGLVAAFSELTISVGAAIAAAAVAGTLAVGPLSRVLLNAIPAGERAFTATIRWADDLGKQTDAAMAAARAIQERLPSSPLTMEMGGRKSLVEEARLRAQLIVYACWGAFFFGLAGVAVGILRGFS